MSSRLRYAKKNIYYGYIGALVNLLIGFISRTVFIYALGVTYLGVNGLYTNVLSVLSLAELGFSTAMNYSLYKPVAEKNINKIKSLMALYRKAYLWIALFISIIGLIIVPFLSVIIKDPGHISIFELQLYYLIFLINTVSTYFVAYKYSLVNAEQKNYIQTNINLISSLIIFVAQVTILIMYKDFLIYLLVGLFVNLVKKVIINQYLNKLYPYLREKNVEKLSDNELRPIKKNIKALIFHKIGEISVHQTDNIVISTFINVATVGIISNYSLLIKSVTNFINIIFNSVISSFGNFIATESKERQLYMFKNYQFLGFWIYGFSTVAFVILLNPFIELWLGREMLIDNYVVYLIMLNYFLMGQRIVVNNFKKSSGIFDADKFIAVAQAIVNLVVSITLVIYLGLPGVFIGTIVQGLIPSTLTPIIVYRIAFQKSAWSYFRDWLSYAFVVLSVVVIMSFMKNTFFSEVSLISFFPFMVAVTIIPNAIFLIFNYKRPEFSYFKELVIKNIGGAMRK